MHGVGKGVDACTEVDGDISEPCKLADTSVLQFGFHKVISGEIVGDSKGIESVGADVSIKVRGVRKEWDGLGLFGKAGGSTACFGGKMQMVRTLHHGHQITQLKPLNRI